MLSRTTLPPAGDAFRQPFGPFPVSDALGQSRSSLACCHTSSNNNLYTRNAITPVDEPVKTYIAPCDPRNLGTNATISYCTNGTVLSCTPRYPTSFGGRTSSIICVMERSGMDGAHKWNNTNNVLGTPGNAPPFPQLSANPSTYKDGSPQGFYPSGSCIVGFADGHAKLIVAKDQALWNGLCDPAGSPPPPGW